MAFDWAESQLPKQRATFDLRFPQVNTLYTLTTTFLFFEAAFWASILITGFLLYCLFPMRALPWAAGSCLVRLMTTYIVQWISHTVVQPHPSAPNSGFHKNGVCGLCAHRKLADSLSRASPFGRNRRAYRSRTSADRAAVSRCLFKHLFSHHFIGDYRDCFRARHSDTYRCLLLPIVYFEETAAGRERRDLDTSGIMAFGAAKVSRGVPEI